MSWATRAAENLMPLSRERSSLAEALGEWRYTGNFNDLETRDADCELCDHPEIRYQFEIQNLHTAERLLVGSECIHRFGVAATDEEGRVLDAAGTRKKVEKDRRKLVEEARKRRVITALVALAHADTAFNIKSFVEYLQDRGAFTPKQLLTLQWRLTMHGVPHDLRDLKLTIRRDREKEQLIEMEEWQLERIRPALSATQHQFLIDVKLIP
jgi:hypothetical protein